MRYKITLDYVGTAYHGWQHQNGQDTVQDRCESALESLFNKKIKLHASGRTDAGVHALGQTAHFDAEKELPIKSVVGGLNHFLPLDIRVRKCEIVDSDFHARKSVVKKTYMYLLYQGDADSAVYHNRATRVYGNLDIDLMSDAAKVFLGKHDFVSFMSTGSSVKTTVREVYLLDIIKDGDLIKIFISANGFLYNMVRLIVAQLIKAGKGEVSPDEIKMLIDKRDKDVVKLCASASGLYLYSVEYQTTASEE